MARTMQTIQEDIDAIEPYSMHVSSRYLDLTKQKLELTRLPKENDELSTDEQWELGVPKSVLEPLLDHWLESYSWRASETTYNTTLPQYRTLISLPASSRTEETPAIRTHFVHARPPHPSALPLLYIHSWPGSFIEAARLIPLLTSPDASIAAANAHPPQPFHVIAPSIPGFGFSNASSSPSFGIAGAADVFAALMRRLGYESYVVLAGGWGFEVARCLAHRDDAVKGVFTWDPVFAEPRLGRDVGGWVKWLIARWTGARWRGVSFGYIPSEVQNYQQRRRRGSGGGGGLGLERRVAGTALHTLLATRPQTLAFSLADSPVGLLAMLLDLLPKQYSNTAAARPRSPFLDPGELEMQEYPDTHGRANGHVAEAVAAGGGHERVSSEETVKAGVNGCVNGSTGIGRRGWSSTDVLDWVMMMWLPGAESGLRWLRRACIETSSSSLQTSLPTRPSVPLGISTFRPRAGASPLMWGRAEWDISWVRRREIEAEMPGWEVPETLAGDVRDWVGQVLGRREEEV